MAEEKHEGAASEHKEAEREHEEAQREHERARREHIDKTGLSGRAKRRRMSQRGVTCWPRFGDAIYIYMYIYTPNLGLGIAGSAQEREQGLFRWSRKGARGVSREQGRVCPV